MKKKSFIIYFILSIIFIILAFAVGKKSQSPAFAIMFDLFILIGKGLRNMSLKGGTSNIFSILIYTGISLIPIIILGVLFIRKKAKVLDLVFLIVLTIILFFNLYYMINPHLVNKLFKTLEIFGDEGKYIVFSGFMSVFYLFLLMYLIIRLLFTEKSQKLRLNIFTNILIGFLLFIIFYYNLSMYIIDVNKELNDAEILYSLFAFLLNNYIFVLVILEVISFRKICFNITNFEKELITEANKFKLINKIIIISLLGRSIFLNIYQIAFGNQMNNISFMIEIPLFEILVFYLAIFLVNSFIKSNELNEESKWVI